MSFTALRRGNGVSLLVAMLASALLIAASSACAARPAASNYPTKAVDLVVPFAAGGTTDQVGRIIAPYLQKKWGQPVNVVNKAGGGGTPGTVSVVQAAPDGYQMVLLANSNALLNDAVQKDLPYHWDSVTHVTLISLSSLAFATKGDSKFTSLKDLAEAIKQDPTKLSYGSSGVAGPSTFATAQLAEAVGVDPNKLKGVAFDGGAPAATAAAGGHVDFVAQNMSEVLELVKGGQLKALAVTTPDRDQALPNVPTTKEAGYASVNQMGLFGVAGPAKLPDDIVKKWEDGIAEAMKDSQVSADLVKIGTIPAYKNSKDFRAFAEGEYKKALATAEKLGIRK